METKQKHYLDQNLKQIESANRAELNALFQKAFRHTPAPRTSLTFMRENLSWAEQARIQGQTPATLRNRLLRQLAKATEGSGRSKSAYRPGTRLVREWQGAVYEITVLDDGYAWEGRTYRSLTKIATEIAGTKWSGPRFFGLKGGKDGAN